MNPFNKFEAIGMFAAVAVMALSLAVVRFGSDTFITAQSLETGSQLASVVAVDESTISVEDAIVSSVGSDATLNKLVIDDVRVGTGHMVEKNDTVTVHYVGQFRDGTKFEDSYVSGRPYTFTVGDGKVIRGWEEGIIGMQKGGERILVIPPELAYGNRTVGPIPANSPLIFRIELISIEQ